MPLFVSFYVAVGTQGGASGAGAQIYLEDIEQTLIDISRISPRRCDLLRWTVLSQQPWLKTGHRRDPSIDWETRWQRGKLNMFTQSQGGPVFMLGFRVSAGRIWF